MDKKKVFSWALYDWANSVFACTVMAGFFPVFFKTYWSHGADAVITTARLGTVISFSSFLIALMTPTLGVIADRRGFKKRFLFIFMLLGVATCIWMSFIPLGDWQAAMLAFGLGMMAFAASCVFYDSLLPSVAQGHEMDYASSLGYSLGYLGGGLLFAVNVFMYLKPEFFGLADGVSGVKYSFLSVGLWWFCFTFPLMRNVPEPRIGATGESVLHLTKSSVGVLLKTLRDLTKHRNLFYFLLAYWMYIDGVYTVQTMAVDFGLSLGLVAGDLITALLITQFIGFPFALLFGLVTKRFGCRLPVLMCICIYSITVILATFMKTAMHFYALAIVIGMVQGGVQSLSRSMFGRMIPQHASGEYFGLFNLIGKFASILGPLLVAVGVTVTGNSRMGMLGLLVLFITGGVLLYLVKEPDLPPEMSA